MINMISLGLVTALQHPEQLNAFEKNPALLPKFVEELCRYHQGSAMATRRVAKVDVEYGGIVGSLRREMHKLYQTSDKSQTIKAGEGIIAACQSGDRDEDVFPEPDKFDMYRHLNPADALGFGYGAHRCIAEKLAKAEIEVALGESHLTVEATEGAHLQYAYSHGVSQNPRHKTCNSIRAAPVQPAYERHWNPEITRRILRLFPWNYTVGMALHKVHSSKVVQNYRLG